MNSFYFQYITIYQNMDQLFGEQDKKPKQGKEKKQKQKKKKNKKVEQPKPTKAEDSLELPLLIKMHHTLQTEEPELPLEDFIQFMYPPMQVSHSHKIIKSFQKEDDEGNIEYKLKLIKPNPDRLDHLATQMKFRVKQGSGQAYYRIGVEDDGRVIGLNKEEMYESLKTVCTLATKVRMDITAVRIIEGIKGNIVELMIRKNQKQGVKLEIRLLMFGEPGSGKSTLLGVLTTGEPDDGKGYTRTKVFTHKHELMSGTTQTKTYHAIGFDSKGRLYNHNSMMSMQSWLQNSSKILSFIDVGGHKEKQVVSSLCSLSPEYALWMVSALNKNINTNNLELAKIFNLPLIVVISHVDKMNRQGEIQSGRMVKKVLKQHYPQKTAVIIKEMEETVLFSRVTSSEEIIPIFFISCVTKQNIQLLINFFNLLPSINELRNNEELHAEFLIQQKLALDGNIILAGTVIKGQIKVGHILHLGPDLKGAFRAVEVISIQCMRVPVQNAKCGQLCAIGIRPLIYAKEWLQKEPKGIRQGMVLVDSKTNPKATYEFGAQFILYGNNSQEIKISSKYQPVVNTQTSRQICEIITLNKDEVQLQEQELSGMIKLTQKKSKSIDMSQKYKLHHSSHSTLKSIEQMKEGPNKWKNKSIKEEKIKHKQSIDLQIESGKLETKHPKKLDTIKQMKFKKKKEKDSEIKFTDKEPTLLRLRFKYHPEYIQLGQRIVINELKLLGKVKKIYY